MLLASISCGLPTSASLEVEERGASQSGQTEVGSQGIVVRQLFHPSALNWELKNTWTRVGQFRRVSYHAYIRGKVLFASPDVKQARRCHHRKLAITSSRHTGSCLVFTCAICTDVPVTDLNTLPSVRLDTHCSRRPHMLLPTAVHARQRVRFGQRKWASSHRGASSSTRPPSQPCPIRRRFGRYNEDRKVHPIGPRTRNFTWYDFCLSRGGRG